MKKILYLAYNGLSSEISAYLKLVNQDKYNYTLIVPEEINLFGENIKFSTAEKVKGIRYIPLKLKQPPYIFFSQPKDNKKLIEILTDVIPDLIIIQSELFNPNAAAVVDAIKKVSSKAKVINFVAERYVPSHMQYFRNISYFRPIIKSTDFICCRNQRELCSLKKHWLFKKKKLFQNYWGTNPEFFYPLNQSRKETINSNDKYKNISNFNQDDFILGYVGRLCDDKGLLLILEALQALPPKYKLVVAGSFVNKVYEEIIYRKIKVKALLDRVYILGYLPYKELNQLYSIINLLVVPTYRGKKKPFTEELFGRVLAEAMLSKTLVIGSSNGAIPEILGNTKLIFEENNSKELNNLIFKISNLNREKKESIKNENFTRAKRKFTSYKYVERLEKFINKNL